MDKLKHRVWRWQQLPWGYLSGLLMGYTLVGWLLSIYQAPGLIWIGTQAITLHLAWRGNSAIALGITWVVGIIWSATLLRVWPASLPLLNFQVLVIALLFIWLLGLVLILTVAFAKNVIDTQGFSHYYAFCILLSIAFSGLELGRIGGRIFLG